MSVRRLIIEVVPSTLNVAAFCREHGISTWFFWDLRRRHAVLGDVVLEPRSRAAHRVANRTDEATEDRIVTMRKDLRDAGLDAGAATIGFHLRRQLAADAVPSDATIWRVLKRRGFIVADPSKVPKRSTRRFQAERANECWQIDDTSWSLADGTAVKIINIIDDHSRVVPASRAALSCTTAAAFEAFTAGAPTWGLPARMLSDNASEFRDGLATALRALGIAASHSRPYHPQTCGKVERFHQTLKRHLAALDPAETLDELQSHLDRFVDLYNHRRPHRAHDRAFPADIWQHAPKPGPADQPLGAPTAIHHRTVTANGTITTGPNVMISLGVAHKHQTVTTIITGHHAHVFANGKLIRALTIDPTRRVQPLHNRPGRPTRLP